MWIKWAIQIGLAALGYFIPALKPPSPEADAQKSKDQAAGATSALKAKVEGDAIEKSVADGVAANPGSLRQHDANEL